MHIVILTRRVLTKGGIIMRGLLRVEARMGMEYVEHIERVGADFRIKKFANSIRSEKEAIMCETFAWQFVRDCEKVSELKDVSFNVIGNIIEVSKEIKVVVIGKDEKGEDISKRTSVNSTFLKIVPVAIRGHFLEYSLELVPNEYDESILISRVDEIDGFVEYHVDIPENVMKSLNKIADMKFWEATLPNRLMYEEDSMILSDFIDVLKRHGMIDGDGSDVVKMKDIYHVAVNIFPLFKKMSRYEQMQVFDLAYSRGRCVEHSKRDINSFSKATFEVMAQRDLYRIIVVVGKRYTRVQEFRHSRWIDGKCYARNEIKTIEYEYEAKKSMTKLRRCLKPYDIWHLMALE